MGTLLPTLIVTTRAAGAAADARPIAEQFTKDAWRNVGHPEIDDHVGLS